MWFEIRIQFVTLLVSFLTQLKGGNPLKCFECLKPNCTSTGIGIECTNEVVLHTHEVLSDLNPSLESVAPVDPDYACFLLNSSFIANNGQAIPVVIYGCTFWQTKLCEGWDEDVLVHDCQVCYADECNAISGNTPEPPRPSTTTLPNNDTTSGSSTSTAATTTIPNNGTTPETSTTTTDANPGTTGGVDGRIRIGTKLVIGGLSLMLIFL